MTTPTGTTPFDRAGVYAGLQAFVRYAYPPNLRGFCGPGDSTALWDYGRSGVVDDGLVELARAFTGPWPYLTLIAAESRIGDPFDGRVVEAYWLGNELTDRVDLAAFGNRIEAEFKGRAGTGWGHMAESIPAGAVPHHGFHVFGVYPWVGMLTNDRHGKPLEVLDRCRIRWGRVVEQHADTVIVESSPLTWDGAALGLGPPAAEKVVQAVDGEGFIEPLGVGEWVSLHWDWVCDRLGDRQLANLRRFTQRQLDLTNRRLAHPGPHMVLG
jgi:hypothetical protein